jgi:hypothetical protein
LSPKEEEVDRRTYPFLWGILLLLGLLPLALAPFTLAMEPIKGAKVGEWAEYQVTAGQGGSHTMRRAIVGQEGGLIWYETRASHGKQVTIMKVLVDPVTGKVKRAIVKNPPQPAMEIPLNMADRMEEKPKKQKRFPNKPTVTTETIQVPAGSFQCTHVRDSKSPTSDGVWSSEKVPVGGLVRSKIEDHAMVLTAFGQTGAKTEITETPQTMPDMRGMPRGARPGDKD